MYLDNWCSVRAHAAGEDGSIYLQALAKYLQEEYMRRPLDKILKMVRQHMIRKVQVRKVTLNNNETDQL